MSTIRTLKLHNFRSYDQLNIDNIGRKFVVLYGKNGAGKTNILEAISLLVPGRGLRNIRTYDAQKHDTADPWAVSATLNTPYGDTKIGTGPERTTGKRIVKINGEKAASQNALVEHLSCVWLTPQMDGLFLGSSSERRRFLDRLIFAFDRSHTGRLTRYNKAMASRSKLLREGKTDPAWLRGIEMDMAETGVAIAAARVDMVNRLSEMVARDIHDKFPRALLKIKGFLEDSLSEHVPALEIEEQFKTQLAESRGVDMLTGGAALGPHKSDLEVYYADKNMPAAQSSTGEQKALLVGIVLAHAQLLKAEHGQVPILLFDEIAAHLDESRCAALYDILDRLEAQVWLTGTDLDLFYPIQKKATVFGIEESQITMACFELYGLESNADS